MATVTFPIELGGSGLVVSDDTDPTTGLRNGGYLTRFVPALQQTVAVAGFVVGQVSNAAASASAAAGSASAASSSASSAASSAASAATLYDQFDDRYLGPKASNPTVDNDGNALLVGAMYFNTSALETRVWNGTTWQSASVNGGTVNSLIVTGALEYQETLTGGTGVVNIGSGQIYKDASGNVFFGATSGLGPAKFQFVGSDTNGYLRIDGATNTTFVGSSASVTGAPSAQYSALRGLNGLVLSGSGTADLIINTAGNAGLGVTPSAWGGGFRALDILTRTSLAEGGSNSEFSNNSYFDGANFVYKAAGNATLLRLLNSGSYQFLIAPSGTAGNPITFTQAMTLTQGGILLVGGTSDAALDGVFGAVIGGTSKTNAGVALESSVSQWMTYTDDTTQALRFYDARLNAEAARITSARYFKASNTGSYGGVAGLGDNSAGLNHWFQGDANDYTTVIVNGNTGSSVTNSVSFLASGATGKHFQGITNLASVFEVAANGNVTNTNNSYGAISDPKLKDIIGPKSSTWEKTKQYNWIEYYLKSDTEHTFKMLGLNAEEAAAISPGVVDESPDLVEVTKVRQVPVQIVRLDENENPTVDEESGEVLYDEVMVDEEYTEWEPNGEFTKSVKYSVVSMQYHRTTQECQQRIESLEAAKVQADDLIQQIMARVAALESASA